MAAFLEIRRGLKLPDFTAMRTSLPFILQLRCACEIIFDVLLSAYIACLKAYYDRSEQKAKKQGSKRRNVDGWDRALQSAKCALAATKKAVDQREGGDLDSADAVVDEALLALRERYTFYYSFARLSVISHSFSVQEQCRLYTHLTSS